MSNVLYTAFKRDALKKIHDLVNDDIKVALVNGYTVDQDGHAGYSDITNEVANGNGYTTGGVSLTSKAVTADNTNHRGKYSADNASWSDSTITATGAVIYNNTASGKPLIAYIDFGGTKSDQASIFTIQWDSTGVLYLG